MKRRTLLQAAPALIYGPSLVSAQTAQAGYLSIQADPLHRAGSGRRWQSGFKGFDAQQWYGVVGPAGMPARIVQQLNETLATVLKAPDLGEKLSVEAIEPVVMSPEQFAAFIKTDIARWTRLARDRKIELDS